MNKVDTTTWAARSFVGALLLFLLAAPLDLQAQDAQERTMTFTEAERLGLEVANDVSPVVQNLPAVSKTAALTFYTDRTTFETDFPDLTLEDFATSKVGPGSVCADLTPLDSSTDDACYGAGDIVDGFEFNSDGAQGPPVDYAVITVGFLGTPNDALGPNTFGDNGILDFVGADPVGAAGFNVACPFNPGSMDINVYGAGGLLGSTSITCGGTFPGVFVGVSSDSDAITSIEYADTGSGAAAELMSNLVFGGAAEADLWVAKECDANFEAKTASFHVDVANHGPGDATGVEVLDALPGAIVVTGWSTTQGTFNPFSGIWEVGDLPGDDSVASLWIDVDLGAQGRYTNEVWASSEVDDPDESNNHASCSFILLGDRVVPDFVPEGSAGGIVNRGDRFTADLAANKLVNVETAPIGGEVHYFVEITNQGPQSTAKVEVTDHLPECLTDATWTVTRGEYDGWLWDIGKLKVDETVTLEVWATVGPDCSGTVTNTAEVTASSLPDPDDQFSIFDQNPVQDEISSASFDVEAAANGRQLDGTTYALGTNYPNPFNPVTVVPFSLAEASNVSIQVYDLLGRSVATLVDGTMAAGVHEVRFEASHLPTGMYLVRMEAAGIVKTMRVTLMK